MHQRLGINSGQHTQLLTHCVGYTAVCPLTAKTPRALRFPKSFTREQESKTKDLTDGILRLNNQPYERCQNHGFVKIKLFNQIS